MPKRAITQAIYDRILRAFREHPEHPVTVAKIAKVDPKTARRAWDMGWASKGLDPIKEVFLREKYKARAADVAVQTSRKQAFLEERERALSSAAHTRAEEGQMVLAVRSQALEALNIVKTLIPAAKTLADNINRYLVRTAAIPYDDPNSMAPKVALDYLSQVISLQSRINSTVRDAVELERIVLGVPDKIEVITSRSEMSMDEATARIEMAVHAIERAKALGGISAVDSGLSKPKIGKPITADMLFSKPNGVHNKDAPS